MTMINDALRRKRTTIFERVVEMTRADQRIAAAWLSGSQGRGTEDDWSDIDLHIAVHDANYEAVLRERQALYRKIGDPTLIQQEMHLDNGTYQLVLFKGPVMLDFVVHPVSKALLDADEQIVFDRFGLSRSASPDVTHADLQARLQDRIAFFWLMTPIALKYIARGHTQRAITQYDLISGAFVAIWRLLNDPDRRDSSGPHWLHPIHDAALIRILPDFGVEIEPSTIHTALLRLMSEMLAMRAQIASAGAVAPQTAIDDIAEFSSEICRRRGTR